MAPKKDIVKEHIHPELILADPFLELMSWGEDADQVDGDEKQSCVNQPGGAPGGPNGGPNGGAIRGVPVAATGHACTSQIVA